jgi:hypothetical protein
MYTSQEYNFITKIKGLEAKLSVATDSLKYIDSAVKVMCDKNKVPEEELKEIRNGIWDLRSYLEQK